MTGRTQRFVSFSANNEDVLLHRIFGEMPDGVFVDVGAADPRMENDCKALYDQGWSGINVEPNPTLLQALVEQRPRDRSFGCALGAAPGEQTYYEVEGTGLSTLDPSEAERCRNNGWTVVERTIVVRTLASLLEEAGIAHVDLLKVDVEGWEENVLRGNDWSRIRPSVIMVEATLPERPERRTTGIEALLRGQGYRLAHFDGLNDFFVRTDFGGADNAFSVPPNVFDGFVSYRLLELEAHASGLEAILGEAKRYSEAEHTARLQKQADLEDAQRILLAEQQANRAARKVAKAKLARLSHDLTDSRGDCMQLRTSLVMLEKRVSAYAERMEMTHREREELLILRSQLDALHRANHVLEHRLADMGSLAERRRLQEVELSGWITAIRRSTSWRLSLPLRVGGRAVGRLTRRIG